jgi:hypothetical protein
MARSLSAGNLAALAAGTLVARDFIWFVVRDRVTGDPVTDGMWSDVSNVTANVLDPDTGLSVSRTFYGSGTLIQVDDVPLVSSLTVQNITIRLSQVEDRVEDLVRTYDAKQGRVELYRGLFDPSTRSLVAPAYCRFVGFIDKVEINTGAEDEEGGVVLTCVSHTQELTRYNPDTRSDTSQKERSATDNFFADASVVGSWEHFWGKTSGTVSTEKKGLFGWGNLLGFL